MAQGAILEGERVGLVLRVAHLALTKTGLTIMSGTARDGGSRQPSSLGGAFCPAFSMPRMSNNGIPDDK